jgi:hypothetical protein
VRETEFTRFSVTSISRVATSISCEKICPFEVFMSPGRAPTPPNGSKPSSGDVDLGTGIYLIAGFHSSETFSAVGSAAATTRDDEERAELDDEITALDAGLTADESGTVALETALEAVAEETGTAEEDAGTTALDAGFDALEATADDFGAIALDDGTAADETATDG